MKQGLNIDFERKDVIRWCGIFIFFLAQKEKKYKPGQQPIRGRSRLYMHRQFLFGFIGRGLIRVHDRILILYYYY